MAGHLVNTLREIVENSNRKLSEIEILTVAEQHRILEEFNNTGAEYSSNKTIQELFAEQVVKTPGNIALVYEDWQLTYQELNAKSNQLARLLRSKGVKPDSIVGIMVERSSD
jgi:non-ribosomal peptide synthetase component F